MSPWEDIEADPEFGTLTPQEKVSLFDDWHKNTVSSFAEIDPEEVDPQGLKGFMASGQIKRRELLGEPVDPDQITRQYLTGLTERNKSQKQMLADYDALEKARFNLQDATLQKGVTSAGDRGMIISPKVQEILGKPKQQAEKEFEIARSKFTPELEQQAREAREAMRGERPVAVLGSDIYTDPSLTLDKEEYRRAVNGTSASPEAKMLALADFTSRRDEFAKNALRAFRVAGEAPIPGMESFASWEAKQPEETRIKSPESKALEYLRQMRGREGYRKLISAIGTGAVQGGADVASQAVGTAAMITGDRELAQRAGEVQKGAQALSEVQKLEGDMSATGATTAGGVARLGVGMAPAIGAGLLTGGSLPAAALAAGAQTAGAQFPSTYNAMLEQGKSEDEALRASRGAALMSGAVTSALTALGGTSGVEALIRRSGEGFARGRVASILLGSIKEIPEELADEAASQVIESSLTNPDKPVSQVVDEFLGQVPDLALQVGLLGGAGEAFAPGGKTPSTSQPTEESEEPMILGRTVQQVLDEAAVQAEESGSPLLAQAIAEQAAAPVPEAQAETAEPSGQTEPVAAAETISEESPAVNAVTTEEQETLPLLPQEEGQAGESRTPAEGSIPAVTAEKMPDTSEVSSVAPSAEVPAIQEPELSEGAQRNQELIAQAAATNAGRAPVSANEYIQKAAAAPQSNLPPVTLQEGEAEVQAAPERAVEQNPVAAMAAQAAAKARGEVKEVSAPLSRMLQPKADRLAILREMRDLGGMLENEARALLEKDAGKRTRILSVLPRVSKAREVGHILQNARRAYENQATPEEAAPEVVQISEGAEARVGGTTVGRVTTGPVDVETARRMFPDQVRTGDEVRRVQGIDLDEKQRGKGIGKQLYVTAMDQAPDAWYYNSQATKEAARALRSLERYGLIELHVRQERDGEFGPHIKRLTEEGRKYAQNLAGKELPEAAAPATAENIADRINASSLSPATTYPSLVQDIKSLTEGKPARLQEVADALFDQPMPRPTAEKIARRLLDENAAEREATASRDRRVAREMIGEEENQRGGEAPVSDDRAPLEKGEFVAWQDESGATQEGVLTKISAGRNNLGEPMSEVTLETSEVVQVPRRELRPMASQRMSEARRLRMNALKSLYGHLGTVVSVGVSAVDGINAMTSLQNEVPGVQKAWIGTREEFLADERLGKAFPGILNVLKNPGGDTLEGLFDAGRVFVFTDNVGVYEGDVRSAKEQSEITGEVVTPQQAAVQRVVLHEGLAHRGFYALDKDTRRALFQWGAQNIYETEMDEVNDLYGFSFRAALDEVAKTEGFKDAESMEEKVGRAAVIQKATEKGLFEKHDWRTNERSREWIMEEILAKKIERLKAPPKSGPLKALWDILASLWRKLTGSVQEVTLKDIQDVAKVLRTALELSENNVETRNGMPIRVEVAKGSLRPRFTSPLDATLSDTAKALRLMRDGSPATPVDLQQAYATAVRGKSSAMVSLDDLFAAAKASSPSLTEAEFGQQVQNLYNDNGAYVESAESPAVMKQSADRYNVRSAQGIPATYVMILETGRPMASMRPDSRDAEYLAAVEAGDMAKAQRMVDEAAKAAGYSAKLFHGTTATEDVLIRGKEPGEAAKEAEKGLRQLAEKYGVSEWRYTDAYPRMFAANYMGITQQDVDTALKLKRAYLDATEDVTPDTNEKRIAFNVFNMPSGEQEFGVHVGNEGAASMFGEVFPFWVKLGKQVRLPDLGTWGYQAVIRELRKKGVQINGAEYDLVFNSSDPNSVLRQMLRDKGFESIVYRNEAEGRGDSYILTAPAQIKSADPVTYDDAGNVIPLSQRFQTTSPDIRFSLRPDAARRLNRAVWEAQEASGPIKDSEQTPLKDYPVHSFAQQSGESRTAVAIQIVDELLKSGVPVNGLVEAINSYDLHRQLGIERDPDMLGILLAEAMRRGDPNAFKAYQVARERAGRALGTGAILHKDPRFQHLFLLEGMKDEQVQQARDILNANAPMTADEVKRLDAEAGRTAAAEDAGAVQDALEEDLLEIGEKGLSPKERTLWEKAKYLVARIGYLLKLGSGDAKPSLRFEFPDSEKQALSKLSADERQKELQKTRAELRATLGELLGQRKPRKAAGGVETIEGDLTTRAVADMIQRMQERLNIPVDAATAIDALTTTGNLKGQFENFISDSLISKVKSAMTPKQAPVKNLNSVIRQITSILADNLNLPKAQTVKESLGERALDTFGRVRSNERMIREAWERSREGIRQYLAERAVEGKEGLTEEEAAEIEEAVDAQLDAIASSVPARMWARGQAYSLIRDALEGSKFDTNEDILRDPQTALKTVQDRLNSEVSKIGNVDPARWDSDQAYIVAAFNSLVADLKERKAKAEARRAGKTRSGLMTGSDKKILTSLIEQARKRSGDKAPLLPDSATWTKIFSGSPQSQEAKAKEMLDYMKADPLLSNLTAAEQQQLADMFARRWEQKRKELLEAKVASILKARNATPKGKNAAKDAVPKFIQAINRGELTNDVIAEEIAEKFGFEKLTEGEKKTLERLSRELQEPNLPQHEKTAKIDEMAQIIARKTNMSKAEILSAWWVTSVLSGPRTAFTIGLAASNGAFEVLGHAVSTVLNANWNGRRAEGIAAAGQALKNYFKSWPRAIQLAWQYVLTGDKKLLSAMDPAYSQFFETGRNNPLSVGWRLSQSKNPVARATGRFMHFFEKLLSALDLFTATTTRHGMLPISYYLNQKTYDKARVANETDLANYRKKVIDLWWGGKEPTTGAEQALVTRQSINMMEEQLAKYANVLEDAGFAAAQAAMTLTPEGLGGQFYQAVRSVANKAERSAEKAVREAERLDGKDHGPIERNTRKALAYLYRFLAYQMLNVAGLRFARFAGNKLNQSLGFIPGLGLLRKFEKDYVGPMKNQAIMRNQAIGAMMAMVGYNVLKAIGDEPDDDKRGWGIEGSWKNLTPDQIKQLQAAGRKQYTIHIGDMSFNYANWPVSSVLAAIGTMADRIKYSPDKWKETSALDKIATGAWAASTATMDASSLSQLAEVFGSNIHTRDPVEASAKWASRVFGNYAGGMIPRVFKDADLILDGKMGKYDGWENFGKEIPVYRRYVGGPLLDIFGKQVEVSRTPWSREFQVQPPEREYRLLGQLNSNDLWLAPANPGGRRVGRGKRSREMTDAEQKRYVTLVGDGYRKVVLKFGDRLAKMDREEAKDLLGKLTAQVRDRAERQAVTQQ